ncbi:MAG: DNA internalization-related competence protein ComEC/Rec2 [Sedimentisphaerales bacterium]|nr:DNA internalization-related competence protein ComEC/Rec2 [Sedimentisphaerales bacterium]
MDSIDRKIKEFQNQLTDETFLPQKIASIYPAALGAIGLITGLVLQFYFKLPLVIYISILAICTAGQVIQILLKKISINLTFVVIFFCFLSLGSIRLIKYNRYGPKDIRNIAAEDFTFAHIRVRIISDPKIVTADEDDWLFAGFSHSFPYTTFYAKVTDIKTNEGWTEAAGKIKFYISGDVNNLNINDTFQAFCKLQKFYPPENPGQFETARYMKRNGVFLAATLKSSDAITMFDSKEEISKSLFNAARAKLRQLATIALGDDAEPGDSYGLVAALLLGERGKISPELYDAFITTGLAHLISLSGLHVGIIAAFAWWLAKKCGLLHRGRAIVAVFVIIIFLLTVPARTPTLRAGIMFIILCFGRILDRPAKAFNNLAIAAIVILLIRPMDFLSPGFQLSFSAVIGIILFSTSFFNFLFGPFGSLNRNYIYTTLQTILGVFSIGCAAWLATAPILAWHFYQFQPFTVIWTIPAFFLVAAILILGVFKIIFAALLPTLAAGFGFVTEFTAGVLSSLVILFAKVPFSHITIGKPCVSVILAFYILILLWRFCPFRRPVRNLIYPAAIILLIVFGLFVRHIRNSDNLQLTILSVGHGQAVVGQLGSGKNIIIDAGSISKNDVGDRIVNPFFDYAGLDEINTIFISHDDIDHYNGVPEILKKHNCENIFTTPRFIQNISQSNTASLFNDFLKSKNLSLVEMPEKILFDKTTITLLWPKNIPAQEISSDNESSLVLLVEYAGRKIMFCSDITKNVQEKLIEENPQLDIDIMTTPHHGSARNIEPDFLSHFKPEILITSCSASRLGGTSKAIANFEQSYYTPKDGTVTVLINRNGQIKVQTFK